nr:GxxExxY protein [Spirosoma agri]
MHALILFDHLQLLTYLRTAHLKLGPRINFNVERVQDGVHRKINGNLTD